VDDHQRNLPARWIALLVFALVAVGCAGRMRPTRFTNPRIDFSFVQRVAVLPFENLSSDQQAGTRATRLMVTELLSTGAVEVVEPGEVAAALGTLPGRVTRPSAEQVVALGKLLHAQALIAGTVAQSEVQRGAGTSRPTVTLDAQMIETETGEIIWDATHTAKGSSFAAKALGTEGEPLSVTTRRCVAKLVETLLER